MPLCQCASRTGVYRNMEKKVFSKLWFIFTSPSSLSLSVTCDDSTNKMYTKYVNLLDIYFQLFTRDSRAALAVKLPIIHTCSPVLLFVTNISCAALLSSPASFTNPTVLAHWTWPLFPENYIVGILPSKKGHPGRPSHSDWAQKMFRFCVTTPLTVLQGTLHDKSKILCGLRLWNSFSMSLP